MKYSVGQLVVANDSHSIPVLGWITAARKNGKYSEYDIEWMDGFIEDPYYPVNTTAEDSVQNWREEFIKLFGDI